MKRLTFKLEYAGKILAGEKRTTIRLYTDLKPNDTVEIYVGHVRVGRAVIKRVYRKKLSELTDEEVKMDGFRSKEDLLRHLARIYGSKRVTANTEVHVVEFEFL